MSTPMREAFEKAGYWPNEVMWKAWQQAWAGGAADARSERGEPSEPERLRKYLAEHGVEARPFYHPACWLMGPSDTRADDRSKTYPGIADAMAKQIVEQIEWLRMVV